MNLMLLLQHNRCCRTAALQRWLNDRGPAVITSCTPEVKSDSTTTGTFAEPLPTPAGALESSTPAKDTGRLWRKISYTDNLYLT
ncbi:hypothetical protein J6590_081729 [Homalodisca vitripennis]|nr:hypothetical protein J6590_081729 [Homalodisca vitripennis]